MVIRVILTALGLLLSGAFVGAATAAPLNEEECTALKQEYDRLLHEGVKSDMERSPDWAKANLPPVRLEKIARLIVVEEQLSFRCDQLVTARPALAAPQAAERPPAAKPSAAQSLAGQSSAGQSSAVRPDDSTEKPKPVTKRKKKPKPAADAFNSSNLAPADPASPANAGAPAHGNGD
jgi:hypothetical protein